MGPLSHAAHLALSYSAQVALATLAQLALVLGPPLALAALVQPVALRSERYSKELVGERPLWIAVGWIATALHESGHAALALLFGHRVTRVKWFDFSAEDGALGQVEHEYDAKSFYQRAGRFFIGVGPLVVGTLALALAARFLLGVHAPAGAPAAHAHGVAALADVTRSFVAQLGAAAHAVAGLARALHADRWQTWLFLYVAWVSGTAMRLSASDVRAAGTGLWTLGCVLLAVNALTLWAGAFATTAALHVAAALALCDAALLAAIALQLAVGGAALAVAWAIAFFRARDAALASG